MLQLIRFILFIVLMVINSSCKKQVYGCTDGSSINFNPFADLDDGSCRYHYSESDSIESVLISSGQINIHNFAMFRAVISVKNVYTINSNYGYEGMYYKGSAYSVEVSGNSSSPWNTEIEDCNSNSYQLIENGSWSEYKSTNESNKLNFDCQDFINLGKITSGDVYKSEGYEFKIDGISNIGSQTYDSLVFGFHSPGQTFYVKKAITSNNIFAFTAGELAQIVQGKGYIEVIGMNTYTYFAGSIPYMLINETIRTQKVNFY